MDRLAGQVPPAFIGYPAKSIGHVADERGLAVSPCLHRCGGGWLCEPPFIPANSPVSFMTKWEIRPNGNHGCRTQARNPALAGMEARRAPGAGLVAGLLRGGENSSWPFGSLDSRFKPVV